MKTFIKKRWAKHYHRDNKNRYWHLIVDSLSFLIILVLLLTDAYLSARNYGDVLGIQNQANVTANQNQNTDNQASTSSDNLNGDQTPTVILPTTIEFRASAKYYTAEGEQLGFGPLPPVAGQATRYWLFIEVGNFYHDLAQVLVTAKLPANVSLTGKYSVSWGENITFGNDGKEINWLVGDLSTSDNQKDLGAAIEVEVIPNNSQIGQAAVLLDQLTISALDKIVNKEIKQTRPAITSGADGLVRAE